MNNLFNTIEIEINHGCNKSCSYCPNSVNTRIETGHMKIGLYEELMLQLKGLNYSGKISYSFYNEPTLSPNLELYISLAKKMLVGVSIELYSNGTLIDSQKFKQLIIAGVDKFIITKHEKIENYEFDKTYSLLSSTEKLLVNFRNYTELKLTNRGGLLKEVGPEVNTKFLACKIPDKMLTITVDGNVVPCFEDFFQKNEMGNIGKTNILDIWNSDKYKSFRKALRQGLRHKFEACKDCNRVEVL